MMKAQNNEQVNGDFCLRPVSLDDLHKIINKICPRSFRLVSSLRANPMKIYELWSRVELKH